MAQTAPPAASSTLAFEVNGAVLMMLATSRTAPTVLARVMTPINDPVMTRSQVESRSIRPGSPIMRIPSRTATTMSISQDASPARSSFGRASRKTPQARMASAIGHRGSAVPADRWRLTLGAFTATAAPGTRRGVELCRKHRSHIPRERDVPALLPRQRHVDAESAGRETGVTGETGRTVDALCNTSTTQGG